MDSGRNEVTLETGKVFSGMAYGNAKYVHIAENGTRTTYDPVPSGNVYKMLKYYDPKTGVLNIAAMGSIDEVFETISVQCTRSVAWAWARVSDNLQKLLTLTDYTHTNGALRVGPYTYDDSAASLPDTDDIVSDNGADVMYQSYAAMLPADGLASTSAAHMMMCSVAPTVVYRNGKIDPDQSYLYIYDQHQVGTLDYYKRYTIKTVNGTSMRLMGGYRWYSSTGTLLDYTNPANTMKGEKWTFRELYNEHYIPFTLPELIGQDDVEPITTARNGNLWFGSTDTYVASGLDYTYSLSGLLNRKIHTQYGISHFRYEVKNKTTGETVLCEYPYLVTKHFSNLYTVGDILDQNLLSSYTGGNYTIHIYAYLATGEWHEVFYRTLID